MVPAMSMIYDCPKFSGRNAPICPMHEGWRRAVHVRGEAVCLWLRELQKSGGTARVAAALREDQFKAVSVVSEELLSGSATASGEDLPNGLGNVRREMLRAAGSGSKLESGTRFRAAL
jgi:hypothetical protein